MNSNLLPVLQLFLGFLGIGLSLMFCTTFCRACLRYREEQLERERLESELLGHTGPGGRSAPVYFIPFPRQRSHQDEENPPSSPGSHDIYSPPRYSTTGPPGPPPSYNELEFKPEDLPPAYTEHDSTMYPMAPPPHIDTRSMSQP